MRSKNAVGVALLLAALVLVGSWLLRDRSKSSSARGATAEEAATTPAKVATRAPARHADGPTRPQAAEAAPRLSERARRDLLGKLERARKARASASAAGGSTSGESSREIQPLALADKTGSTSEWEKRQIDTLNQLLAECYDLAADEDPDLAGTLGVQFTITGEPAIGGVVDDIEVMEDYSTIEQASMRECVRESLYGLELDPPPEGVQEARQVTLTFEPE